MYVVAHLSSNLLSLSRDEMTHYEATEKFILHIFLLGGTRGSLASDGIYISGFLDLLLTIFIEMFYFVTQF